MGPGSAKDQGLSPAPKTTVLVTSLGGCDKNTEQKQPKEGRLGFGS